MRRVLGQAPSWFASKDKPKQPPKKARKSVGKDAGDLNDDGHEEECCRKHAAAADGSYGNGQFGQV